MKIGQPADPAALSGASQGVTTGRALVPAPVKAGPGQPAPAAGGVESSAKVELSSAAATLMSTQKKSVNPDFDADKVAQVSQAISDSSYKVNAEAIADKLIANAQELLGKVAK